MKAQAEFKALLLQLKNYERLKGMEMIASYSEIIVRNVPKSLIEYFTTQTHELIEQDQKRTIELMENAAQAYVEAMKD